MSSGVDSDILVAEKSGIGSAKPGNRTGNLFCLLLNFEGLGSRATSKVTFRDGEGKQQAHSSAHPTEGEQRPLSFATSLQLQQQPQFSELKKKDDINPFKFSPDVDFCALSQLDKREKAQVSSLFDSYFHNY